MKYVGIQTQIDRNNRMSILLLLLFPCILLGMVYVFIAVVSYLNGGYYDNAGEWVSEISWNEVNMYFLGALPWVVIGVGIWFTIAYFANTSIIANATNARPLERRENPRVYNIVENLCMTCGMDMPQINVVHDDMLNAFASGINKKTYTVTVTTGLLNLLNDDELAGVILVEQRGQLLVLQRVHIRDLRQVGGDVVVGAGGVDCLEGGHGRFSGLMVG